MNRSDQRLKRVKSIKTQQVELGICCPGHEFIETQTDTILEIIAVPSWRRSATKQRPASRLLLRLLKEALLLQVRRL